MADERESLEYLFVSKVRIKALKFFFLNPNSQIHLRGAVRELEEEINAVRRELIRLETIELIKADTQGNRKYFKLNTEHPFYSDLIRLIHKSYGLGNEIISNHKNIGSIEFALFTSAYTKGAYVGDQVIDLAVIGDVKMDILSEMIKRYEDKNGREIHYTVMKTSEFYTRKRRRDEFITNMLIQDITMLIGKYEDFVRL